MRRRTSASKYFRKFSATTPGSASTRKSFTVSCGKNRKIIEIGVDEFRTIARRIL
jgi:hypothetical protein